MTIEEHEKLIAAVDILVELLEKYADESGTVEGFFEDMCEVEE